MFFFFNSKSKVKLKIVEAHAHITLQEVVEYSREATTILPAVVFNYSK